MERKVSTIDMYSLAYLNELFVVERRVSSLEEARDGWGIRYPVHNSVWIDTPPNAVGV